VIDLGGYDGQWTSDLFSRYLSEVHVFEAVPAFAEKISRRFAANSKIRVYPYAVGRNSRADRMSLCGVGSSLFTGSGLNKDVAVRVEDAGRLFRLCNISHCDLLKINIEGANMKFCLVSSRQA
jgi:FkbM family methyltransferase